MRRHHRHPLSLLSSILVLVAGGGSAAVIQVPADQPTVAAGLAAASFGDSVVLACATFNEWDLVMPDGVALLSATGDPACTIIDAGGNGWGIKCDSSGPATFILGITFAGGNSGGTPGGGLKVIGGGPTITNCVFESCSGFAGGAGGAVQDNSNAIVLDCVFQGNVEFNAAGGGLLVDTSSALVDGCRFFDNESMSGGGIAVIGGSAATVSSCRFGGNSTVVGPGGAIWVENSPAFFSTCQIVGNSSNGGGGGGAAVSSGSPLFSYCLFTANESNGGGGAGMSCDGGGTPDLEFCDFVANRCNGPGTGAAIKAIGAGTVPALAHCILAFGIGGQAVSCVAGAGATMECSDVFDNSGGDYVDCLAGQNGVAGNFSEDPLFCDMAGENFHICFDSPCFDTGGCGLFVGAYDIGCGACGGVATRATSWSGIKTSY